MELFGVYIKFLRGGNGNLSTFWLSYGLHEHDRDFAGTHPASTEADWMLRLSSVRAVIPCCLAYDMLNYARYLPYYCAQMFQPPNPLPYVHAEFMQGEFSVQLGSNNPFGRIPVDQTIKEAVNKDTQTSGGPSGSV